MSAAAIPVLVCGHDVGGLNLLAPLLYSWRDGTTIAATFVGVPATQREIEARLDGGLPGRAVIDVDLQCRRQELDAIFDALIAHHGAGAVLTGTSSTSPLERRLVLVARRRGIPAIAFCDMWWAMETRFREPDGLARPDELWLVDPVPNDAEQAPWPQPPLQRVIGHPLYARRIAQGWSGAAPSDRPTCRTVRFLSEPASTQFPQAGIDEFALAELVLVALRGRDASAPFVVRPHPTEAVEPWRRWCWARRDDGVGLDVEPLESCFSTTGRAIGIGSSLLIEMRLAGIPSAALRMPGADPRYFALPFEDMDVALIEHRRVLEDWLTRDQPLDVPAAAMRHRDAIIQATRRLLVLAGAHYQRAGTERVGA